MLCFFKLLCTNQCKDTWVCAQYICAFSVNLCLPARLPVWLSSNMLVLINVVTLRQARLLPGWVT